MIFRYGRQRIMSTSPLSGRLKMGRLALAPLAAALALGTLTGLPAPAAAQYYSPYYDAPPVFGPPRGYRYGPPVYEQFSPSDVKPMLRSMGFGAISTPRVVGNAYVAEATDADGVRQRVRIDRYSGRVLSMRTLSAADRAPIPPANVKVPPKKPAPPQTAALPPVPPADAVPPVNGWGNPPAAPSAAAPAPSAPGGAAPAVEAAKPLDGVKPADVAKPADAPKPAQQAAIPPAGDSAAKPAETPVRVIPGVAGPNPTPTTQATPGQPASPQATTAPAAPAQATPAAPEQPAPPVVANAKAGTGAGTGTPGGSVSAGTASVLSRDATKKPAEKPKTSSN